MTESRRYCIMIDDYYAILGVARDAPLEEIERSYRELVVKCHPDLQPANTQAARLFRTLQRAVETLRDPQRRKLYDLELRLLDPVDDADELPGSHDADLDEPSGSRRRRRSGRHRSRHASGDRDRAESSGYREGGRRRSSADGGERRRSRSRRRNRRDSEQPLADPMPTGIRGLLHGGRWWILGTAAMVLLAAPAWMAFRWWATSDLMQSVLAHEERHDYRAAADAARDFVRYRPRNAEGVVALAVNYARAANSPDEEAEAQGLLRRALMLAPDEPSVLRELARMNLASQDAGRFSTAENHVNHLLELNAHDGEAWRLKVQALEGQLDFDDETSIQRTIEAYQQATAHNPSDVGLAVRLADLHRRQQAAQPQGNAAALANQALDTLVRRNPTQPAALLARYRYRITYRLPGADADLDAALKLDDHEAVWLGALRAMDQGRPWLAAEMLGRLIVAGGGTAEQRLALALAQCTGDGPEVALATLSSSTAELEAQGPRTALLSARSRLELQQLEAAQRDLAYAKSMLTMWAARATDDAAAADLQLASLFLEGSLDLARLNFETALPKLQRALSLAYAQERSSSASRRLRLCLAPAAEEISARLAEGCLAMGDVQEAAGAFASLRTVDDMRPFTYWAPARIWLDSGRSELAADLLSKQPALGVLSPRDALQFARGQLLLQAQRVAPQREWQTVTAAWPQLAETAGDQEGWAALDAEACSRARRPPKSACARRCKPSPTTGRPALRCAGCSSTNAASLTRWRNSMLGRPNTASPNSAPRCGWKRCWDKGIRTPGLIWSRNN